MWSLGWGRAALAGAILGTIALAGATPDARAEEGTFEHAGKSVDQSAQQAGQAIQDTAQRADEAVKRGLKDTGQAIERGAQETGAFIERTGHQVGRATGLEKPDAPPQAAPQPASAGAP